MAIDAVIAQRWRSGRHVGTAKPRQTVRIQRGLMDREHSDFRFLDGSRESFGKILGTGHGDPARSDVWHAFWRSTGDWIDVPNVSEVQIEGGFDDNGIGHATIRIENVLFSRPPASPGSTTSSSAAACPRRSGSPRSAASSTAPRRTSGTTSSTAATASSSARATAIAPPRRSPA